MARRIFIILSSTLLLFALSAGTLWTQQKPDSGLARVKSEILQVRSENLPGKEIVMDLKKGEVVWIQMEIVGSEGKRCLISDETRKASLGFVSCDDLESLVGNRNIAGEPVEERNLAAPQTKGVGVLEPNTSVPKESIPSSFYLGSLLQAIWKGDISVVGELLGKGADPNAQTKLGDTPLHVAATREATEITELLIAKGADVNSREHSGKTPLIEAASMGRLANAEVLLKAGADINAKDEKGYTALMWATMRGFPEFVEVLLENGADVNARSKDGTTAMWISGKMVENAKTSLFKAFKSNSKVPELQAKLATHENIFRLLKEAGGKE